MWCRATFIESWDGYGFRQVAEDAKRLRTGRKTSFLIEWNVSLALRWSALGLQR